MRKMRKRRRAGADSLPSCTVSSGLSGPGLLTVRISIGGILLSALTGLLGGDEDRAGEKVPELRDVPWLEAIQRAPSSLPDDAPKLSDLLARKDGKRITSLEAWSDRREELRAAVANLRHGELDQGGSTLTQQLMKNVFLTPERSLIRKLREAALALRAESLYDMNEILECYLNEFSLGQ